MNLVVKTVVFGGTGFVGTRVCSALNDRGVTVTAIARSDATGQLPAGVDIEIADVTDQSSLVEPLNGADSIINLVAVSPLQRPRGGEKMHDQIHRQGTRNIVEAARHQDVSRLIQMSGIHADPDGPTHYLRAKGRAEAIVREEMPEWVIFRPTVLFGDGCEFIPFMKRVAPPYLTPLPGGGQSLFQPLGVTDLANMISDAILDDSHSGEIYEVGGPTCYSLAETATLIHKADGRPTHVLPIPMKLAGIGMHVSAFLPGFPFGPDQYESLKLDLVTTENAASEFIPIDELATFEAYLGLD